METIVGIIVVLMFGGIVEYGLDKAIERRESERARANALAWDASVAHEQQEWAKAAAAAPSKWSEK